MWTGRWRRKLVCFRDATRGTIQTLPRCSSVVVHRDLNVYERSMELLPLHLPSDAAVTVLLSSGLLASSSAAMYIECPNPFIYVRSVILQQQHANMPSSSFHIDHAASLPYVLAKTNFKGRVFMTHPTKAIYKWLVQDSVRVGCVFPDLDHRQQRLTFLLVISPRPPNPSIPLNPSIPNPTICPPSP